MNNRYLYTNDSSSRAIFANFLKYLHMSSNAGVYFQIFSLSFKMNPRPFKLSIPVSLKANILKGASILKAHGTVFGFTQELDKKSILPGVLHDSLNAPIFTQN